MMEGIQMHPFITENVAPQLRMKVVQQKLNTTRCFISLTTFIHVISLLICSFFIHLFFLSFFRLIWPDCSQQVLPPSGEFKNAPQTPE